MRRLRALVATEAVLTLVLLGFFVLTARWVGDSGTVWGYLVLVLGCYLLTAAVIVVDDSRIALRTALGVTERRRRGGWEGLE